MDNVELSLVLLSPIALALLLLQARVQDEWFDAYISGSPGVQAEVQGAILQRNCQDVREVLTLRGLLQEHETTAPVAVAPIPLQSLEDDRFALLMKQMEYDLPLQVAKAR